MALVFSSCCCHCCCCCCCVTWRGISTGTVGGEKVTGTIAIEETSETDIDDIPVGISSAWVCFCFFQPFLFLLPQACLSCSFRSQLVWAFISIFPIWVLFLFWLLSCPLCFIYLTGYVWTSLLLATDDAVTHKGRQRQRKAVSAVCRQRGPWGAF